MSKESKTPAGSSQEKWNDSALNSALARSHEPVPPVDLAANITARVTQKSAQSDERYLSSASISSAAPNPRRFRMAGIAACFAIGILAVGIVIGSSQLTPDDNQQVIVAAASPVEALPIETPAAPSLPTAPIAAPAAPLLAAQEPIQSSPSLTIQPDIPSGNGVNAMEVADEKTEEELPLTPDEALPASTTEAVGLAQIESDVPSLAQTTLETIAPAEAVDLAVIESDAPSLAQVTPETIPAEAIGPADGTGSTRSSLPVYGPPAPSGLGISGGMGNGINSSNEVRNLPDTSSSGWPQGGLPSGGPSRGPSSPPRPR